MKKQICVCLVTLLLTALIVCGCAKGSEETEAAKNQTTSIEETSLEVDNMFTDRDKEIGYDESTSAVVQLDGSSAFCDSNAVQITDSTVTITKEGTYILTGELSNGSVVVDAEKTDKIQIVLDGADINCYTSAAIYVKQADKVVITLAKSSQNSLSNAEEFVAIDDNNIDAVIFSKDDLTMNGEGALTINAMYGHGVVSKDDLVVAGGTYAITAAGHALSGKDSVRIADGSFNLTAETDGIHAENADDTSLGFIYIAAGDFKMNVQSDGMDAASEVLIDGGTYEITAADDGVHSDTALTVRGGDIAVAESYEGLEGQTIDIQDGTIHIKASDDGLNAAGGNDQSAMGAGAEKEDFQADADTYINISGGTIQIDASGDGVDSNGALYVSGGTTYVSGPTANGNGALDYNGEAEITGGIFVAVGASGMVQNFGSSSTQGAILTSTSSEQAADSTITLSDSDGKELLTYTASKKYSSVLVSCPEVEKGKTYTLAAGSESISIEMTDIIYGASAQTPGGGMGGGKGGTRPDGAMPEGEMPDGEKPNGTPPDGMPQKDSQQEDSL